MALKLVVDTLEGVAAEVQPLYVKDEATGKFRLGVEGLPDVSKLETALQGERTSAAEARKALKDFQALGDPAKIKQIMSAFESSAEMKLIAEGKFDEVIKMRTEKMQQEFAAQLKTAGEQVEAERTKGSKWVGRVLDQAIINAANAVGIHKSAFEDALFRARAIFTIDDDGNPIQKTKEGAVVMGKDGATPFSPTDWIESMREKAPHWFPAGGGSGSPPNGGGGSPGAKVMKRSAFENLSPQARLEASKAGISLVDG